MITANNFVIFLWIFGKCIITLEIMEAIYEYLLLLLYSVVHEEAVHQYFFVLYSVKYQHHYFMLVEICYWSCIVTQPEFKVAHYTFLCSPVSLSNC